MRAMGQLEHAKQSAADLYWLVALLTGCQEIAVEMTVQAIGSEGEDRFSTWMNGWSRRIIISKALTAIREDLARSARRTEFRRRERPELPPSPWVLHPETTKAELERALVSIDVFPRAAVLLLIFERMPMNDAANLLNAKPDLLRIAIGAGLRDLTINLARMQGRTSGVSKSNSAKGGWQHVCSTRTLS